MNKQISVTEAAKFQDDETVVFLDVREGFELDICKIENSLHIPLSEIPTRYDLLPKDKTILVLCHHGRRSQQAQEFLLAKGFDNAINMEGGIRAWAAQVDPQMQIY